MEQEQPERALNEVWPPYACMCILRALALALGMQCQPATLQYQSWCCGLDVTASISCSLSLVAVPLRTDGFLLATIHSYPHTYSKDSNQVSAAGAHRRDSRYLTYR